MTYIELHCHTNFSFLDGASPPEDLVRRAAELGMPALAVTDNQGLYGAVKFANACRRYDVRPIYGAEVAIGGAGETGGGEEAGGSRDAEGAAGAKVAGGAEGTGGTGDAELAAGPKIAGGTDGAAGAGHVTLLAQSGEGWANLCRMLTEAGQSGTKHERPVPWSALERYSGGLICLTGCRDGVVAAPARRGDREATLAAARRLKRVFGPDRCYVELQRHFDRGDRRLGATLVGLARHLGLPLVATNNVHYSAPDKHRLQHILTCIRQRTTLDEAGTLLYATPHRYLKGAEEMAELFADLPEAIQNTGRIAERCHFELDLSHAKLPGFPVPEGDTPFGHLLALCYAGLRRKYDPATPESAAQLTRELGVIEQRGLAEYFLIVHDIVAFARERGILCQGRGSAAGSLVAYVLDITPVDPLAHELLFDRFLAEDSNATPDIDVDFAADRREEVIQYVYEHYGASYTAMVANVVCFRSRSAVADVGKVLGFPADLLVDIRKHLYARSANDIAPDLSEVEQFSDRMAHLPWQQLLDLCAEISGYPRHLSIHVGGMIVTAEPLAELVPLEPATMSGRVVVQWDKDDVEDAGLIKIDLLSLRTLGVVAECFDHARSNGFPDLHIDSVPPDDPAVWEMLAAADAIGVFQVESRAQMNLLPRMRPHSMSDLIVEVALIRPGPIQGGMAKAYMNRRDGDEPVSYWHPSLVPVLEETLGIIVFQEQVLRTAMAVAGFTGAQADGLRRSMSRKRSLEAMEQWRAQFVTGAGERGIDTEIANFVFDHLLGFASYGFCKSHAAAFAKITYVTAWLKCHHPAAFYCGVLNNQPMGFYSVEVVLEDAKRHGVGPLPLDVNVSGVKWALEDGQLRVPLARLKGMGEAVAEQIVTARGDEPFADLWDFVRRARPPRRMVERLIRAGALDGLAGRGEESHDRTGPAGKTRDSKARGSKVGPAGNARRAKPARRGEPHAHPDRRELLWALGEMSWEEGGLDLPPVVVSANLPATTTSDAVSADYSLLGLAQDEHLLELFRPQLADLGVLTTSELEAQPHGARARVAGRIEIVQRPPPAKGIAFVSIEDENGLANLLLFPDSYERNRHALRASPVIIAEGEVQRERGAMHLITERIVPVEIDGDVASVAPEDVPGPAKEYS